MEKLISVILPVYNSEKYISEAIQSILDQTYTNFELLVLDDGSTDNTVSIIESFNDKRITLFRSDKNFGIVHQLNKGIENSKGEFIARMDADDISYPDRFRRQIDFFENNNNIDILGTDAISFGVEEKLIKHKNYKPVQISFLLNFFCPLLHPTIMMRKRIFKDGLIYPKGYKYAEDLALWRILDNGKNIAILQEILLRYRIHSEQTNADSKRRKLQEKSTLAAISIPRSNKIWISLILPNDIGMRLWQDKMQNTKIVSKYWRYVLRGIYSILKCNNSMVFDLIKNL